MFEHFVQSSERAVAKRRADATQLPWSRQRATASLLRCPCRQGQRFSADARLERLRASTRSAKFANAKRPLPRRRAIVSRHMRRCAGLVGGGGLATLSGEFRVACSQACLSGQAGIGLCRAALRAVCPRMDADELEALGKVKKKRGRKRKVQQDRIRETLASTAPPGIPVGKQFDCVLGPSEFQ